MRRASKLQQTSVLVNDSLEGVAFGAASSASSTTNNYGFIFYLCRALIDCK
jgi:hypothetical protein